MSFGGGCSVGPEGRVRGGRCLPPRKRGDYTAWLVDLTFTCGVPWVPKQLQRLSSRSLDPQHAPQTRCRMQGGREGISGVETTRRTQKIPEPDLATFMTLQDESKSFTDTSPRGPSVRTLVPKWDLPQVLIRLRTLIMGHWSRRLWRNTLGRQPFSVL